MDKYHDYDNYEYKGIKDIKDSFNLSVNKDYYKPTLIKSGYNGNYVQYESKGDKILSLKEYLALIENYLRELINYYKNKGEWKLKLIAEIIIYSNPYAFIEYSSDMNDVLDDINNYNKNRDKKVLIIFDDMIADIKELFIRCIKLNISIVFITQSYFRTPTDAKLNSTHYILMKVGNKKELKSIAEENSGHSDFKDLLLY